MTVSQSLRHDAVTNARGLTFSDLASFYSPFGDSEGEFLGLRGAVLRGRLLMGCEVFERAIGCVPRIFVPRLARQWRALSGARRRRLRYTEDHRLVYDLGNGRTAPCPAMSWATRTRLRRALSPIVCERLLRAWHGCRAIRIALHPLDFEHATVVESITCVLGAALQTRRCASHADLF